MPHYDKKPPAPDGRIPLYLRRIVSTQCHRTAIVLTGLLGCLVHYRPAVPMSMARGVPRGQSSSVTHDRQEESGGVHVMDFPRPDCQRWPYKGPWATEPFLH